MSVAPDTDVVEGSTGISPVTTALGEPPLPGRGATAAGGALVLRRVVASIPTILLILTCVAPPAWLVLQLLIHPSTLPSAFDPFRLQLLGHTLLYTSLVAVIAVGIALPVILVLGRGRGVTLALVLFCLPVALLLPSITYAYGWAQALRLIHIDPVPRSVPDIGRCIWTLAGWLWPIPAAVVGLSLRRLDDQVQQQALLDGVLWRTTFRQLLGPLVASAAVVGVMAAQEFSVWERTGISVVATEVRMIFESGAFSSPTNLITQPMTGADLASMPHSTQAKRAADALATSFPMFLSVASFCLLAYVLLRRNSAPSDLDAAGRWPHALDPSRRTILLAIGVLVLTLVIPIGSLLLSMRRPLAPIRMFNTFSPQLLGSLTIASLTAVFALAISFHSTLRHRRWPLLAAILTFLIGGQLIAISLIRTYNHRYLGWIYDAPPIVILAHLSRFLWIPLAAGAITFTRPWGAMRDMASLDGATPVQAARYVILPLAWPLLLSASIFVLILSLGEAPATVLLVPQRPPMLIPMLATWVHLLRSDDMIEATLLTMTTVIALTVVAAGGYALFYRTFGRVSLGRALSLLPLLFILNSCGDRGQPDDIWLETGNGPGQVVYPRGIVYKPQDDTFFVVDRVARVQHLDRNGHPLAEWRMPEWQNGKPVGLAVGPDGNLYVPDTHYHRVIVYTPEGKEVRRWGSEGAGPGQFVFPTHVAFDDKGRVFVSEYGDHDRIQVFDQEANYLYEIGSFGDAPGQFSRPDNMVIDGDTLYVSDNSNHRIDVFKTDGTFLRSFGSPGDAPGQFRFPRGMTDDGHGHLVIAEFGNNRVQLVDKATGKSLGLWGTGGRSPGELAYPWGVAVDSRGRVVVVDSGNNRLQVFRF